MKMNKIVLTGVLTLGLVCIGFSQNDKASHKTQQNNPSKNNHKDKFAELNLSKEQEKQVHMINTKYGKEIKKVEDNSKLTKEQEKASVVELKEKKNAELKQVLSADQFAKLEQIRAAKKLEKKEDKEEKLKEALGLTEEQSNQVKRINEKYKPQLKAVKDDTSLAEEAKKAKIKTLQEAKHKEINALLTPTQQKKFKEMKGGKK